MNIMELKDICGLWIQFKIDGFRILYCAITCFVWLMTSIFSIDYLKSYVNRIRYQIFSILTLAATLGVFLSANLFTTFIFFEIMSFTSFVLVAHDEKKESIKAACTYLFVAIFCGLVMLMGLFLLYDAIKTLEIAKLWTSVSEVSSGQDKTQISIAGACLIIGFGAKAGLFPLHFWLPQAHPVAPAPASAILSGILTKTGIFGVLIVINEIFFQSIVWGQIILWVGVFTMVIGAVLAIQAVNIKKILACSTISQIGFIVVGIALQSILQEGRETAIGGTILHMINHSFFKLVFFLIAGVIYMNTHKLDIENIRGFGRKKPFLQALFLITALGISGVPLFSGYISKSLLHESLIQASVMLHYIKIVEGIFIVSGALTIAYMLKLYVTIFIDKNSSKEMQIMYEQNKTYISKKSMFAVGFGALLFPMIGLFPNMVLSFVTKQTQEFMHIDNVLEQVAFYNVKTVAAAVPSILIGVAVYLLIVKKYFMIERNSLIVNSVKKYSLFFFKVIEIGLTFICRLLERLVDGLIVLVRKTAYRDNKLPHELEEGSMITHAIGSLLDKLLYVYNQTLGRKKPIRRKYSYEHRLAMFREEVQENNVIISRSLSFGLLLFCLGFIITIGYLIW